MKRLLALLLVSALIVGVFGACGQPAAPTPTPAQQPAGTTAAPTPTPAPTPPADGGLAARVPIAPADPTDFNPDDADGMNFLDMRTTFGSVPAPDRPLRLGAVAKAFANEYWRTLREGYIQAQDALRGVGHDITITVSSALTEDDLTGQLAIVQDMVVRQYDGLMLSPISDGNLIPGAEDALAAGIPVLNVNDGLVAIAPHFIGPRAVENGWLAAEWVSNQLDGQGQVAIIMGMPLAFAARQRTLGFEQWMAQNAPGIEIVETQNADWDRARARDLAETWISLHPDLRAIFANNDTMALGAVEAVQASGRDILVVGVDGIGEAYDSIRAGGMSATVDSFPYFKAQVAVEGLLRTMAGQELPRVIWTPQALIDSTNVDVPAAQIIGWQEVPFS